MKLILFVLILFFAGFTYLVVTLTNNEIADIRSRGAVTGTHETESGILVGNASITNDTSASNGKYVLLSSSSITPTPTGPLPTAQPGTWQLLGTHPYAPTQGSTVGKMITELEVWNGKVFMGYGDDTANTGPIRIVYYDPVINSMKTVHTEDTEAIYNFRILNNKLYAPAIDPRSSADYAVATDTDTWTDKQPVRATHVFDMNTLTGTDVWMAGSLGTSACVWRSVDGGTTWQQSICEGVESTISGDFARYYFLGVYNNRLYIQARDFNDGLHSASKVFDGTRWSNGPSLNPGWGNDPVVFAGKLIFQTNYRPDYTSSLRAFNGSSTSTVTSLGSSIYNYFLDTTTNELFVIETDGEIRKTSNLTSWSLVGKAPAGSRSISVLNGDVYIGTPDSKLYRLN